MIYKTSRYRLAKALNLKHFILNALFFTFHHVEGAQSEDDEEKQGDHALSEDNDTASINLDDEQNEDDDDANSKKTMFVLYFETFLPGKLGQRVLKTTKFLIPLNALL